MKSTLHLVRKPMQRKSPQSWQKKIGVVAGATQGGVPVFDENGCLSDSGVKPLSVSVSDMTICFTEN